MKYYTYAIVCTAGKFKGKVYFGQHKTEDLDDGYKGSGRLICHYYKKHPDDYVKIVLQFFDNQDDIDKAEYNLIHPHLNKSYCLNLRDGGNRGDISSETRQKISCKLKGKPKSEEHIKHMSEAKKGCKFNQETRQRMSEAHKGVQLTTEHKKHISEGQMGREVSQTTRQLISIKQKGVPRLYARGKRPLIVGKHISEAKKGQKYKRTASSPTKGKHRVYDNPEHTKWHFE